MSEKSYLDRKLLAELKTWLDSPEIIAIKGPRQVGKTTLATVLQAYLIEQNINPDNIHFITFEDREILEIFRKDPRNYIQKYTQSLKPQKKHYFFIDEFQYLKEGGQKLKLLYDVSENIKFVITGSSSLEITDQVGKFLVGRALSFNLWPLDFEEFLQTKEIEVYRYHQEEKQKLKKLILERQPFKITTQFFERQLILYLEEYVLFGGYPNVILNMDAKQKQVILKNIYEAYLTRDIISLLRINNVDAFTKITTILANQIGSLLNYQNLANDSASYFTEIKRFLSVLEETYIIKRIKPYFRNASTEVKKNPKLYFIDTALRNSILANFDSLDARLDKGSLIENFVLNELIKNIEEPNTQIRYWRTTSQAEVDFVVVKGVEPMPLEVKMLPFKKEKISRSFRSFIEKYKPKFGLILTENFTGKIKIGSTQVYFAPVYYI